jgi:hypothetical protein
MDKNGFLIDLSESDKTAYGRTEDFAKQSTPQKVFSAIWALEAEVNNGGFSQYFFNTSNETAGFVVEALGTVGAPQTAEFAGRPSRWHFRAACRQRSRRRGRRLTSFRAT